MANFKDFATGTVSVAPSPASSGNTATLQSGEGSYFPTPPFYATAHPDYQLPTLANAEKILVTGKTGDQLTFQRAQGDTTAKNIAVGWRISNAVFKDDLFNSTVIKNEIPGGTLNAINTSFTVSAAFNPGTLEVYLNGQRLKSGSGNDYVEGSDLRSFTMQYAPFSDDVLVVDYIVGTSILMQGVNVEVQETPSGSVNGSNTAFTTSKGYVLNTLKVYVNGLLQALTTHVTQTSPSAGTFSLDTAPATGDIVRVIYDYALSTGGNAAAVNGVIGSEFGDGSGLLQADFLGWRKFSQPLTYASATTFTIPGDYRTILPKGSKLWLTQTTSKYFNVINTSFSSGVTTVTVTGGSDYSLANAAITAPYFSYEQTPVGFPAWFNFTPGSNVGWSSMTVNACRFRLDGTMCTAWYNGNGTSNSTDTRMSLPITAANLLGSGFNYEGTTGLLVNNGGVWGTPGRVYLDPVSDPNKVYIVPSAGTAAWTASGGKSVRFTMQYEIA